MDCEKKVCIRDTNVELLRIISMLGVIVLHYNNVGMGGGFSYVQKQSMNYYLLYILEALSISAVNLFVLISGYFMCMSNKRGLIKPLKLLVQVVVFREAGVIVFGILNGNIFSVDFIKEALIALIPNNYFVVLYVALYFVSKYFNIIFDSMNETSMKHMLLIVFCLFSVWPTMVDVLIKVTGDACMGMSTIGIDGSQKGYTIVNFVLMYVVGAYLRKIEDKKYSIKKIIVLYIMVVSLIAIWSMSNDLFGWDIGGVAWEYCNPLVIIAAILIFLLFKQIKIKNNKIINAFSKGCFSVFLLHSFFLRFIQIEKFCTSNVVIQILHILFSAVVIYIICWIVDYIYNKITYPVFSWLERKLEG